MKKIVALICVLIVLGLSSCGLYNKNIMFKTKNNEIGDSLLHQVGMLEKNYIVQKNDFIYLQVLTNKGEMLVDPTGEVGRGGGGMQNNMMMNGQGGMMGNVSYYLVEMDGKAKFPLIGRIKVDGIKLKQLDSLLEIEYGKYYQEPYVISRIMNKRVFVLGTGGSQGGLSGAVIPLSNENMNLIEIIALAGGVDNLAKVNNIRLIRGDLKKPNVYIIDLSTIEGVKSANMIVQPNDIIYIERYGRVVLQAISNFTPIFGFLTTIFSIVTLIFLTRR